MPFTSHRSRAGFVRDNLAHFPELLKQLNPHLPSLNLNGVVTDGAKLGKKHLPPGQGDLVLSLPKAVDGLDWLSPQLAGKP